MRRTATRLAASSLIALMLAACSPDAPKGVDQTALDDAISKAIGDPGTCVLIADRDSGRTVYRYNTHTACGRDLPSCEGEGTRTTAGLLKLTLADGQPRTFSCNTAADASRGVGWASGVLPRKGQHGPLAYAAMMEGDRAFPGRIMADRLGRAFTKAGL